MNLKTTLLASALTVACGALALAPAAFAADNGTITINGNVINSTCNVSGNGGTNDFTVTLPNVGSNALTANGTGAYAASATSFNMTLSGCPTAPAGVKVGTQFYSTTNVDTVTGTLKNTGSATGVDVQLLDGSSTPVTIGTAAPTDNSNVTDQVAVSSTGAATLAYKAQYYVTGGALAAGTVSTTVAYVINYQ